jgi:uncharacterized protein YjbI with pentapeptide repeats
MNSKNVKYSRSSLLEMMDMGERFDLRGADLRGLDLTNFKFAFLSLESTKLDEANLSGALLQQVDLTGASLRGARLDNANFRFVRGDGVNFDGLHSVDCDWKWSSLIGATFTSATLQRTRFINCGLERASFEGADMTLGALIWSLAEGTNFSGTNLEDVETLGTSFRDAELSTAHNFAYCREIVLEVLMRDADKSLETMQWLGAATLLRQWCYPVWVDLLKDRPELVRVIQIFQQYPKSGCLEALYGKKSVRR